MYRIVLVDDEPLILAGIASLIQWEAYSCTLAGKATNGSNALELIREAQPDIVITDIRMPVMDGLELMEKCKNEGIEFAFIVLTNLEEFHLARRAVQLGAVDYLVKLDLSAQALGASLERAKEECGLMESRRNKDLYHVLIKDSQGQRDADYFKRLISSREAWRDMPQGLEERYVCPFIILFTMQPEHIQFSHGDSYDFLFIRQQLMDVLSGITSRYFRACTVLDMNKNTLILFVSSKESTSGKKSIQDFCVKVNGALKTYFGLTAIFGLSLKKECIRDLPQAFTEAKTAMEHYYYHSQSPVVFYQGQGQREGGTGARDFNINFLKRPLSSAINLGDSSRLREIFQELISLFSQYQPDKSQAVSACINLYAYLYSLFQAEGEDCGDIFPYAIDIAEQLGQLGSLEDILTWLDRFCDKLCNLLPGRKENRSDKLVYLTKRYVDAHYSEKLTLSGIAEHLKISPGHLSSTFSKFTDMTVSDYIAQVKTERAKELIRSHQYLIYEVADMLGFENAYYFSKVFKKVSGMSPREYEHSSK